ncbi:MarR family winged helix-turn-helix transcriptional regulator [Nostoc favosum]|uniref:MarR family winged helix-turn-helix transcriptional regulator n=1 Tax=Nostoc favosum CHAB5714 TaxID=2780399 RepID=A0ABS8IAI4_9NOSO|nr:MarR family winged helix-turn-helix transcriptional regulator [Nostoc favosum]MCC5601212.1 MarR family winged helix-turn-helix transcriptional regulator [Nostoc favosum CHAB5714]
MTEERTLNLLGALALSVVDGLNAVVEASVGHGGETPAALVTLGAEPGLSINTLRQVLNLSHPGTVRLIDRLETQGLVERRAGSDGRTLALFLTDAGHERRQTILTERRQQLQFAVTSLTPDEYEQLTQLLEKMLTAMTTNELRAFAICRLCEEEVCPSECCPVDQQYCRMVKK